MHSVSQISAPTGNMSGTTSSPVTDTTHSVSGTNSSDTKTATGHSTDQSHAKGGGADSAVPQKLQEKLPEGVERTVPNALHDTGDQGGLHRKQN
ncbi:hypothetical protein INS49_013403 [Diaporthe citri]|uniref:uncharacterized protein n=1 Tax=Diaporthe citri TaxID=83186 RepID=UPI001C7F7F1A|nr:uncharacterized protein INS49_013403 [Diaporthe citri]KAG6357526.1 hypothetical protein INS49_013403 [Diaporthe citri]